MDEICRAFATTPEIVRGRRRDAVSCMDRCAVIRALYTTHPDYSSTKIGMLVNRHHTTVLFHLGKLRKKDGTPRRCGCLEG